MAYCGQTVGWIKMKLGMQVGFGPGHIVLDGDPAPAHPKGHSPPIFGPYLLWPISVQAASWYGGRPRPRRLCVRWGPSSPSPKREQSPQFSAHVYCDQTVGWIKTALGMEVGLGSGHIVLDGDPAPLLKIGAEPANFWPIFIVAKRLDASKIPLNMKVGLSTGNFVLDEDSGPPSFRPMSWPWSHISATAELLLPHAVNCVRFHFWLCQIPFLALSETFLGDRL